MLSSFVFNIESRFTFFNSLDDCNSGDPSELFDLVEAELKSIFFLGLLKIVFISPPNNSTSILMRSSSKSRVRSNGMPLLLSLINSLFGY
jgi:hypothetical protein